MANNGGTSLDAALVRLDGLAQSLRQSATEAQDIEQAAERLISGSNEHAASSEETRASVDGLASSIEETSLTLTSSIALTLTFTVVT